MPSVYSGATLVKNSDANHANSKPMRSLADRRHTVTDAIRGTLTRLGSKSTKDTKDYYPIIEDEPEARRKCRFLACCIPRNKTARGVCFAVVALVLIGLGVVGYIFWPRFPDFKVLAVELKPTNTFSIVRNATYPNNFNYATFIIALQMNVSVTNNNLYNLNIESLNIATFLNVNKTELDKEGIKPQTLNIDGFVGPVLTGTAPTTYVPSYTPQIGAGNKSAVLFPAKSTKTLMMDLTIAYTPDRITGLVRDPSFAEIINVCGILGKARTAAISYSAKSTVATLKNFGYTPAVNGMVTINCPIAADMISQFQGLVESGVDIMTAFEMVFGGGMGEEVGVMTGGA
ncbi:hypothetical protein DFJ73DRAFT_826367 [Zopfochytrium polystomum]|nr:hypothetical protein DFJ73DRAFT_826367 [Zopfochytrium polystomum]